MYNLNKSKKIVIKVGTSTLTYDTGFINLRRVEKLARTISDLRHSGKEVILVSSGAVGVGMGKLGIKERPSCIKERQAMSAVGQGELIGIYSKFFSEYGCTAAQVLLTRDIVELKIRRENAVNTLDTLLKWGVIPIINENDAVSSAELEFGDNDTLSAIVAGLIGADLLILLSDIDGLYDKDPHKDKNAKLFDEIDEITDELMSLAGGSGTNRGTGGMLTKLEAAKIATSAGINMVIASGDNPEIIYDILDGKRAGTLFKAQEKD
ncbi:MAG: glutamate 5-kinase [Ruminococcaceae bacterium]|nr:glutamate 5-kinase [Oscillospiraceae bacterium]